MKGSLQLVSCVCIVSVSVAQELTAIHINLKGIASALVLCFTQEVNCALVKPDSQEIIFQLYCDNVLVLIHKSY